jgi:Domain of unknown function (DUF4832)
VQLQRNYSNAGFREPTKRSKLLACLQIIALLCCLVGDVAADEKVDLQYAPSAVANPLKGLVPYASGSNSNFSHSMEFSYLGFGELVKGPEVFDWQPLENLLNQISGRGHQAVFRIYLEYPGKKDVIPRFLIDGGLKVHKYLNTNTQPFPPANIETPDYEDMRLRSVLKKFIAALGQKYDGDPRIGFITAGLLGTWGEWHTYPKEELFASKEVQVEVMEAYQAAFKVTPVLLRYPAGDQTWGKAANANRPFGYHDDSFAWATLDTGKKKDDWFYMPALKQAGALEKWKSHPIGGEIRPEAWGQVFDENPGNKEVQDFRECVKQTHVSWLMDTGMFREKPSQTRKERAEMEVRRMGYEFYVKSVQVAQLDQALDVELQIENRGVAPFYYDWPAEYALIAEGQVIRSFKSTGKLTGLLPDTPARQWQDQIYLTGLPQGAYTLAIRVVNPLANGIPLRFANATQDKHLDGWLSLLTIGR